MNLSYFLLFEEHMNYFEFSFVLKFTTFLSYIKNFKTFVNLDFLKILIDRCNIRRINIFDCELLKFCFRSNLFISRRNNFIVLDTTIPF